MKRLVFTCSSVVVLAAAAAHAQPPPPEPPAAVAPKEGGASVKYDKGTIITSDDGSFELKINGRFQFREDSIKPSGADWTSRFFIARARLTLEGHVFSEETGFKMDFGLSERGAAFLKDLYGNQTIRSRWSQVRFGVYKRPVSRQDITSDFALEMPERSELIPFEQAARDNGIMLHNGYEKSPEGLEYAVAVFNGALNEVPLTPVTTSCTVTLMCTSTARVPTNVPADWEPAFVARVGWNFGGIKGYSEADLEGGPLRLAIGVAYRDNVYDRTGINHQVHPDFILKWHGLDVSGAFVWFEDAAGEGQQGYNVQAGYFLTPKHLQVVGRFASIDSLTTDGHTLEGRGGLNYYFHGHQYKVMTDYGVVKDTGTVLMMGRTKIDLFEMRLMAQLIF